MALGVLVALASAEPCPDTNSDGILDNGDITEFVSLFLTNNARADFNGDGLLDNGDIGSFVTLFLAGAPCTPELVATGGGVEGTLVVSGATEPSFLDEHYFAEPSVIEPVPGPTNKVSMLGVGTDSNNDGVSVYQFGSNRQLVIDRAVLGQSVIELAGDGVSYPVDYDTLPTDDPDFMYEPYSFRVHDGLVMALCSVHWYRGTGERSDPQSWDVANTVGVLWKNLDDTQWNIVRDSHNPTFGYYGAVWAMGIPIVPDENTLLVGWTNYQWRFEFNGPNVGYLSKFEKGPDGRWAHTVSLDLVQDASAPADQHFHVVQPYWTGTELRVFLAVGDGIDFNGIYELYRGDLDIAQGASPKAGTQNISVPGTGWTDAGYVHGGPESEGFLSLGLQPTFMLPLNGRIHCGADEAIPAIVSFDPNRPGGTVIDDLEPEYLPHGPDLDTGLGWISLSGDVNDYANPTSAVAMVQPSPSWSGNASRANRVVHHDGVAWHAVGTIDTQMTSGCGIDPGNRIFAGSNTGAYRLTPGAAHLFTPLVSSAGATNSISEPDWVSVMVGQARASITDITDQPALVGPNDFLPGTRVLRVEINPDPVWVGTTYAKMMPPVTDRAVLVEGDSFLFRFWARPLKEYGLNARIVPIRADTGEFLSVGENSRAQATTDRNFALTSNRWTEFLHFGEVLAPLGTEPFGFGFQPQTRQFNGFSSSFSFDLAIEGLYVNPIDFVAHRPGFGESLPDTANTISLTNATLPITVRGISYPLGASGKQHALRKSRNLCTLWKDADNYLSVDSYFSTNQVRYVGRRAGTLIYGGVGIVEWSRGTPITLRFDNAGDDLSIELSAYAAPWSDPVLIEGLGNIDWNEFQLFGVITQSHLGLGSLTATPK